VRRAIEGAGFRVEKRPGYGKKRECIRAERTEPEIKESPLPAWFSSEAIRPLPPEKGSVAVIGAGLAGSAIASRLAWRGYRVEVFDPGGSASRASGNPLGLYNLQVSRKENPISRFSHLALATLLRELEALGVPRHEGLLRTDLRSSEELEALSFPENGFRLTERGVLLPDCGVLNPKTLCELRLSHPSIRLHRKSVARTERNGSGFRLHTVDGEAIDGVAQVVYALGADLRAPSPPSLPTSHPLLDPLPLRAIRGQIQLLKPDDRSRGLDVTLVEEGYATPALPEISGLDVHLVGATYQAKTVLPDQEKIDEDQLLSEIERWPEFSGDPRPTSKGHRVGWRLSSPDKLPLIGPLVDPDKLAPLYRQVLRGAPDRGLPPLPVEPGEWILTALGSRGIPFSSLAALLLADLMTGERLPVEIDLYAHLHSARFFMRNLKKPGLS
jgi:tRNA 5-methylaminomethyl-2-thiouridine biosynthesis bifunctional protein